MSKKPFEYEDLTQPKQVSADDLMDQMTDVFFTDCGHIGCTYGLFSEEIAIAMLAAAESMLWFAKEAGAIKDIEEARNKAISIKDKKIKVFDQSGITKLIQAIKDRRQEIQNEAEKKKVKTETKEDNTKDVHTEHCCLKHGCKYGDEDCSVATGYLKQSHPCESCDWEKEYVKENHKTHCCKKDGCPEGDSDE